MCRQDEQWISQEGTEVKRERNRNGEQLRQFILDDLTTGKVSTPFFYMTMYINHSKNEPQERNQKCQNLLSNSDKELREASLGSNRELASSMEQGMGFSRVQEKESILAN